MLLDGMTPPTQHPAPRPPSLAGSEAGMLEGTKPKGGDEKLGLYRGRLEEDECPLCAHARAPACASPPPALHHRVHV